MDSAGIPRSGTAAVSSPRLPAAPAVASITAGVTVGAPMPDLRGTPKKLLLPLLLRSDLFVTISGSGYVVSQQPPPGTRVQAGQKIGLELQ